jgi:uncharacterized protein YndB with AHSA1/START domain
MKNSLKLTTQGERELVMVRAFDAPRALVYQALTTPAVIRRWLLGPPGWSMEVCEVDLKVGGSYRYTWKHVDGSSMSLYGTYREIVPPERLVYVESMEGVPGEVLITGVLTEQHGKTTLTNTLVYPSRDAREAMIKAGMEHGVVASYDRLDDVLSSHRS